MPEKPGAVTDQRQEPMCILPAGLYFDDERREIIRQRHDEKCEPLSHGATGCLMYPP
jgi:hypothetical protein